MERIVSPSNSTPGSERAAEPVASMVSFVSNFGDFSIFLHGHFPRSSDAATAGRRFHFVLFEQEGDALAWPLTIFCLRASICFQLIFTSFTSKPNSAGMLEIVVDLGVVQQHFGGNAAHMQASAAEKRILFDHQSLQSVLPGADGGLVSPWAASNDHQIVFRQRGLPETKALRTPLVLGAATKTCDSSSGTQLPQPAANSR